MYEILSTSSRGAKWGGLPSIADGTHEFPIRLKATAKLTKGEWGGKAASKTGMLTVTKTNGVIMSAVITP